VTARQPSTRTKDRLEGSLLSVLFIRDCHRVTCRELRSREVEGSKTLCVLDGRLSTSRVSRVEGRNALKSSTSDSRPAAQSRLLATGGLFD
jgi:hypothetical protein